MYEVRAQICNFSHCSLIPLYIEIWLTHYGAKQSWGPLNQFAYTRAIDSIFISNTSPVCNSIHIRLEIVNIATRSTVIPMSHRRVLINVTCAKTIGATATSTTSASLPLQPARSETDILRTGIGTNLHMAASRTPLHRAGQRAALDANAICRTSGLASRPKQQVCIDFPLV